MNKYNISKICPICEKVVNDDLKNSRVSFFSSPKNCYKIEIEIRIVKSANMSFLIKNQVNFF